MSCLWWPSRDYEITLQGIWQNCPCLFQIDGERFGENILIVVFRGYTKLFKKSIQLSLPSNSIIHPYSHLSFSLTSSDFTSIFTIMITSTHFHPLTFLVLIVSIFRKLLPSVFGIIVPLLSLDNHSLSIVSSDKKKSYLITDRTLLYSIATSLLLFMNFSSLVFILLILTSSSLFLLLLHSSYLFFTYSYLFFTSLYSLTLLSFPPYFLSLPILFSSLCSSLSLLPFSALFGSPPSQTNFKQKQITHVAPGTVRRKRWRGHQ